MIQLPRADIGIKNIVKLDPLELVSYLEIPTISLSDLLRLDLSVPGIEEAVAVLQGEEHSALSAMTVFAGTKRMIVYNDRHEPARQASDISHEAAHGLLLHQPAPAFDERGCRAWDSTIEAEAAYLGGALLIPGKGARYIAKAKLSVDAAAKRFGCSQQMVNWRLNESGARK
jgi:Zn-dependent peptidase ImmA (M78 family)